MERIFNFEIKMRFFESPNFSMLSQGEETVLARVTTKAAAEAFVRVYALEVVREYCGPTIHDFNEIPVDSPISVEFGEEDFCIIRYGKYTANIFRIEQICPNCGCNPQDEPYSMNATHCPECGFVFKNEA